MIDTLGLPLAEACRRLTEAGYTVTDAEVRSRKGTDGADARVVRQSISEDGAVVLTYARFLTQTES